MPENTPQPEDLYAEHRRAAEELEGANELPEDEHVAESRERIREIEAAIEAHHQNHPDQLVPQDLYDMLAQARDGLMKYRLTIKDIYKIGAEHALESDVIVSRGIANDKLGEWREQARQEMLNDIGRDADSPEEFPGKVEQGD